MRIKCVDVDSFIENLKGHNVYNQTVYIDGDRKPLNGSRWDAISWGVSFQASAVLEFPDGGQALLECGIDCGVDHDDSKDGQDGTKLQKKLKDKLETYCDDYGLMVKPGVVDI